MPYLLGHRSSDVLSTSCAKVHNILVLLISDAASVSAYVEATQLQNLPCLSKKVQVVHMCSRAKVLAPARKESGSGR